MKNNEYANGLEELVRMYMEIRDSKEFRIGYKVCRMLSDFKSLNLFNTFRRERKYKRIKRYNCKSYEKEICSDFGEYPDEHKRIVVYTCITGGYDELIDPIYTSANIKYIAYTDNPNIKSNIWEIRPIPNQLTSKSNVLINRNLKMLPFDYLSDYDYSIYVDGNIRIVSDLSNMINNINPKTGLALFRHDSRNCIYNEGEVCRITGKGNYNKIKEQLNRYSSEGFPAEFGLYEATIIVADVMNKEAEKILRSWNSEFESSESMRDQISLPYVIWKLGFSFDDIGNLGYSLFNCPKLLKNKHL